jgi:hypothetical protein
LRMPAQLVSLMSRAVTEQTLDLQNNGSQKQQLIRSNCP